MNFRRPAQQASHERAQFRWVPFVARLLGEGPLRGDGQEMTVKPAHIHQEALSAVQEMARRAVWRFLARECGWRSRRVFLPPEQTAVIRLWQQPTPPLRFTEASIRLLAGAYNSTRAPDLTEPFLPPDGLTGNGDFLLQFLVYRRLQDVPTAIGAEARPAWARHPFIALHDLPRTAGVPLPDTAWNRLGEPDLEPFLPWLLSHLMRRWQATDPGIADCDPPVQRQHFEIQLRLTTDWIRWADRSCRPDWLTPLLEYFSSHAASLESRLARWERRVNSRSMRERQELATPWANFLALSGDLRRIREQAHAEHPVDRSGASRVYLSAWEDLGFSQSADVLDQARQRLRPVLT